jgi:oxygen-dependent protoporphyrinogen oxidase
MEKQIVIVGGGITGLAAANRLRRLSPRWKIILLEQGSRLGGKLFTERVGDFVVEAGADSFLSRKPRAIGLCEELGLVDRLQGRILANAQTYVWRKGALHLLPQGLSGMIPTDLGELSQSDLLSEAAKLRVGEEPFIAPARPESDESLASFVTRRFGVEAYENIVEPLMSGIYAGQGQLLSLAATFPQLRHLELTYGSLLRGLVSQQSLANSAYAPFVSFRAGMGELVAAIAERLTGVDIRLNSAVTSIGRSDHNYVLEVTGPGGEDEQLQARAIVLACPAAEAGRLLSTVYRTLAKELLAIPYTSTSLVNLAFDNADLPRPLNGYGYVVPAVERRPLLACTWASSKWAGRAPEGKALIRLYLGRYGEPDTTGFSDERLLAIARDELGHALGITAEPLFSRIYRWPAALPQYLLGHLDRVARIQHHIEHAPGLFVAGAYLRGVGIPDCIRSGEEAADAAAAQLGI